MYLIPPNETQIELIKKVEYYQPPERIDEDVTQLIEWLSKQPHLPNITDRKWLTNFIISCKYNLQKSKQIIESYFIVRAKYPDCFDSITKDDILSLFQFDIIYLLPKMTPDGHRIYCFKANPKTDNNLNITTFTKISLAIMDLHLKMEPIHGNIYVYNLKNVKISVFLSSPLTITKRLFECIFNTFPARVVAIHFINPPNLINPLITFMNMLLSNKLKDRIYVHNNMDDLYEYIPKDFLPENFGVTGENEEQLDKDMIDFIMSNTEWLEARPKADLSKLPKHKESNEMDGTFKKLQID